MDTIYSATLEFLENEINLLSSDVQLEEELISRLYSENPPHLVRRALAKINYRRQVYCEKVFTDQTIRHCVLQVQEDVKRRVQASREEIAVNEQRLAVSVDPELAAAQTYNVASLSDDELINLGKQMDLLSQQNGGDLTQDAQALSTALEQFTESSNANKHYTYLFSMIQSTLDTQHLSDNLLKRSSVLAKEIKTMQRLAVELETKIKQDPHKFVTILKEEDAQAYKQDKDYIITGRRPNYA